MSVFDYKVSMYYVKRKFFINLVRLILRYVCAVIDVNDDCIYY